MASIKKKKQTKNLLWRVHCREKKGKGVYKVKKAHALYQAGTAGRMQF